MPTIDTHTIDTHKGLIAWFARNPIAANLLMFVIVLTGLLSALTIRTQIMPDMDSDRINIDIIYPGASPGEVESGITTRVETAVRDIEGIDEMVSYSSEGSAKVRLTIKPSYDVLALLDEVKMSVDRISSLPDSAEKPSIYRNQHQRGAINVQISGLPNEKAMKLFAEQIRREILALPSVTKAELKGARNDEISIEIKETRLRQYSLTMAQVAEAVRSSSLDLPAGSIQSTGGDILLRTESQAYNKRQLEQIVLISRPDGTRLRIGDIATITDGFIEQEAVSLFNSQPSIGIAVFAIADQNQIDISSEVTAYIEQRKTTLPDGVILESWLDSTTYLSSTVTMMVTNMLSGVLLVLIILGLFLRLKLAFWVMLGMPIAFLGAFALMPLTGGSINIISLFGFILVLGIVVDDAIIIGESVQTVTEEKGQNLDNVIQGAKLVSTPATFGVLTTIVAFIPLMLVPGTFGAMPAAIGLVVILCLIFSIIESKLILPAHLASMKPLRQDDRTKLNPFQLLQNKFSKSLVIVISDYYEPFLQHAIKQRFVTLAIFIGMLLLALGFVSGPDIKTVFFPNITSNYLRASIELVEGSAATQTTKILKNVSDALYELNDEKPEDEKFLVNISAFSYSKSGRIIAELESIDQNNLNPEDLAAQWRAKVGDIVGAKTLEISGAEKSHGQTRDISFKLVGENSPELIAAASLLETTLNNYAGVYDIENSGEGRVKEINIKIKPSAEALGLTLSDLANQVRAAFYGIEVQRIQRNREEVKIMVRYPRAERQSLGNLETMTIYNKQGQAIPFNSVAILQERLTPATIRRSSGQRSIRVSANIDKQITQPEEIAARITQGEFKALLSSTHSAVKLQRDGASLAATELKKNLLYTSALALFGIYALMAIPLKSYFQPLIIMGVIPFGMIGALVGHIVVGLDFSALSLFGIVALTGVVVNDSIIMVDFVNKSVEQGMNVTDAAVKAGSKRFRAIMLTSLTTFFGLLPVLLETSLAAQMVVPMAVSLGFGILFATIITLVLVPCLYIILDDLKVSQQLLSTNQ
ncbi:MAG: efflux RND transporter permease subunit [Pseudomonadales bacterium]|nr:efflux RND transporter permease subunit [Pseudomonadales bacterium]